MHRHRSDGSSPYEAQLPREGDMKRQERVLRTRIGNHIVVAVVVVISVR